MSIPPTARQAATAAWRRNLVEGELNVGISTARKIVLGTTVGLVTVMATLAPALAGGRHHHGRHHHHHFRHWSYVATDYGSCDYYLWRWKDTGSRYWKSKYFSCIY
jgi:hypothetical protein